MYLCIDAGLHSNSVQVVYASVSLNMHNMLQSGSIYGNINLIINDNMNTRIYWKTN